jgi:hypothetical protein
VKPHNLPILASQVMKKIAELGNRARLSRGEMAALIAARLGRGRDDVRRQRNLVAGRIATAFGEKARGRVGALKAGPDGRISIDEVARWAVLKYGKVADFTDLPRLDGRFEVSGYGAICFVGSGNGLPSTLEACHTEILRLREDIERINAEYARERDNRKKMLAQNLRGKEK